jgi:hypothetical protein
MKELLLGPEELLLHLPVGPQFPIYPSSLRPPVGPEPEKKQHQDSKIY